MKFRAYWYWGLAVLTAIITIFLVALISGTEPKVYGTPAADIVEQLKRLLFLFGSCCIGGSLFTLLVVLGWRDHVGWRKQLQNLDHFEIDEE